MKETYERYARERLQWDTNIYSYRNLVIPIKTRGRWYGRISQQAVKRGWELPHLRALSLSEVREVPDHVVVYVAFWDDQMFYRARHVRDCVISAINSAVRHGLSDTDTLAFPLLGGHDKMEFLGAMELGIQAAEDQLDAIGLTTPEVKIVSYRPAP